MNIMADSNWQEVTKLSVKEYSNKYNITPEKIIRNRQKFKVGNEILYFIGDKQTARYKWREKWSGPWLIDKVLNDTSIIISDPHNGNQKRVSIDRIKLFNSIDVIDYNNYRMYDHDYLEYQRELLNTMSNYNVRTAENQFNLDYTRFNNHQSQEIEIDNNNDSNQEQT